LAGEATNLADGGKKERMATVPTIRFGNQGNELEHLDVDPQKVAIAGHDPRPAVASEAPALQAPAEQQGNQESQALEGLTHDYAHTPLENNEAATSAQAQGPAHSTDPSIMNVPRRLTRNDDNFDALKNKRGLNKTHRNPAGDLVPAGSGKYTTSAGKKKTVTRLNHQVVKDKEAKSNSQFTSFTNPQKAKNAQDYGTEKASFKARKFANAQLKGKPDVADAKLADTKQILEEFKGRKAQDSNNSGLNNDLTAAMKFAKKDAEYHTEGTIPSRFMSYTDRPASTGYDSDSVSEADTVYDESNDYRKL
jgi:hypothetical protein